MAAILNLAGALLGTAVAHTIGSGIVSPEMVAGSQSLVLSALVGAIVWNLLTWYLGLPSSSSHALIGGLIGAAIAHGGFSAPNYPNILEKIILPLIFSPLAGFLCAPAYGLPVLAVGAHPPSPGQPPLQKAADRFLGVHGHQPRLKRRPEDHGHHHLALFTFHAIPEMTVPLWVKLACALAMGLGTATGGWKIVKTMGHKIFKLEPIHGFAAETAAALVISGASGLGAPISTTHTISTAVIGVGASKRLSAVRWGVAGNLVVAWVLTIPAAALVGAACYAALTLAGLS